MWRGTAALHRAQRSLSAQPARSVRDSRQPDAEWSSSPQCTACGSRPTGWPTPMAPTDGSTETGANGLVDVPPDRLCDRPSRRATAVDGASLAHAAPGSLTSVGAQVARRSAQRRVLEGSPAPVAYSSPGRTAASVTRSERDFGSGSLRAVRHRVFYTRTDRSTVHVCVSALPALSISLIYFVTRVASHGDNTLRSTRHTTTKSPPRGVVRWLTPH